MRIKIMHFCILCIKNWNTKDLILLAMSCVEIGIVGTMRLNSSCMTKGTTCGATLGGMPGFCAGVAGTLVYVDFLGIYLWGTNVSQVH